MRFLKTCSDEIAAWHPLQLGFGPVDLDRHGRFDVVGGSKASLIDRQAKTSARVDIHERLFQRNVGESTHEGKVQFCFVYADVDVLAAAIAELKEILSADVGHQVAEGTVGGDDLALEAAIIKPGRGELEADQVIEIELGTDLGPIFAVGQVGADGREDVAAMEGGGDRIGNHPAAVGDFAGGFEAVAVLHQGRQSVVGEDEVLSAAGFHHDGPAGCSHPGIDHHDEHRARRVVGRDPEEKPGTVNNRKGCDLVGEVDNA